ncbi:MAG: hypothetical protein WAZ34_04230 [Rhodocyclaceae bacterium]
MPRNALDLFLHPHGPCQFGVFFLELPLLTVHLFLCVVQQPGLLGGLADSGNQPPGEFIDIDDQATDFRFFQPARRYQLFA